MRLYAMMPLEMVCVFERGERLNKGEKLKHGLYKVIGGGKKINGHADKFNFENEITVSRKGSPGIVELRDYKFWAEESCVVIKPTFMLNKRFLYHFLKSKEDFIKTLSVGLIPELDMERFKMIKIPVLWVGEQEKIASKIDFLEKISFENIEIIEKQIAYVEKMKGEVVERLFRFSK